MMKSMMRLCVGLCLGGCVLLSFSQAHAQKTFRRCQEVVAYTRTHHPKLLALRASLRVAQKQLEAMRIFPSNPILEGKGKGKVKPKGDKSEVIPYKVGGGLSWKLPVGGWWQRRQEVAKAALQRVKAEVKATELSILLKAQDTCFVWYVTDLRVGLAQQLHNFYKKALRLIDLRRKSGDATILDYNFARMESLQRQADLQRAKAKQLAVTQKLLLAMGWEQDKQNPKIQITVAWKKLVPGALKTLLTQARQQHPKIQILKKMIAESKSIRDFYRAKAIPDIKLKLSYTLENDTGLNHIFGGGLEIPLPLFWRFQDKRWTLTEKIRQLQLKKRAERLYIDRSIRSLYISFWAARKIFLLFDTQLVPTVKRQLILQEKSLQAGGLNILKVLSAQASQSKALEKRLKELEKMLRYYRDLQEASGRFF